MILEWWFDAGGDIYRVTAVPKKSKLNIEFIGAAVFTAASVLKGKNCTTYTFELGEAQVKIHDLVRGSQRYVSLYFGGELVREYNVRAESLAQTYQQNAADYDHPKAFFLRRLWSDAIGAGFMTALILALLGLGLNLVRTAGGALLLAAVVFLALLGGSLGARWLAFSERRRLMERYEIKSSIKKKKKKKFHRGKLR